jgi:putative acetyltransferase
MIIMCTETEQDIPAVAEILRRAFGGEEEALLVEKLRASGASIISMVAKEDGRVAGHILLSPVTLEGSPLKGVGLGPLSVAVDRRRRGIGTLLVKAGLSSCRDMDYDFAVVVGEPAYYSRFGFEKGSTLGLKCALPVPDDVFLARALKPGILQGVSGTVHYLPEFGEVQQ